MTVRTNDRTVGRRLLTVAVIGILLAVTGVFRIVPFFEDRPVQIISSVEEEIHCQQGIYNVHVSYVADNYALMQFVPEKAQSVRHDIIYLPPERAFVDARVYVDDPDALINLSFVEAYEDSALTVSSVSVIYEKGMTILYYFLHTMMPFFVLCAIFLWLFLFYRGERTDRVILILLSALFVCISIPCLVQFQTAGHDYAFHLRRISSLAQGILSGQFPVYMYGDWFNDYGYPLGVVYGDTLLYPAAVLYLCGVPLWDCYRLSVAGINLLTVVLSYHAFRTAFSDKKTGLFACMLYATGTWYLTNIYLRAAIGETAAMAFLPLVASGFYLLFTTPAEDNRRKTAFLFLIGGYSGIIQSHMITTTLTAVLSVVLCLICARVLLREKRMHALAKAALITAVINAWFIGPFLQLYAGYPLQISASGFISREIEDYIQRFGAEIGQLFMIRYRFEECAILDVTEGIRMEIPQTPGIVLMLVAGMALACILLRRHRDMFWKRVGILLFLSVLSCFLATRHFPYGFLAKYAKLLWFIIAGNIQMPTRYLPAATVMMVLLAAELYYHYAYTRHHGYAMPIATGLTILSVLLGIDLMSEHLLYATPRKELSGAAITEYVDDTYIPSGADKTAVKNGAITTAGDGITVTEESRGLLQFMIQAENTGKEGAMVEFPVWDYPGYVATDASHNRLDIKEGENHRLQVLIPVGYKGKVLVCWKEPVLWRCAEILSLAAILALIFRYKKDISFNRRTCKKL